MLRRLGKKYAITILSYGDEIFMERMRHLNFEAWAGLGKVKTLLKMARAMRLNSAIARLMVLTGAFTPIILTLRKEKKA